MARLRVWVAVSAVALMGCDDYVAPGDYGTDGSGSALSAQSGTETAASVGSMSPDASQSTMISALQPVTDGASAGRAPQAERPSGPCDLTGRWLVVLRMVTDALGTMSAAHEWFYYELTQSGTQVTVSKGLHCGEDFRGLSAISGNADFHKVWPAMMMKSTDTGRKGVSGAASSGCQVSFEKRYEIISATTPYYLDPNHSLPSASQQASGSSPGWEDWDEDGQPGYTMSITGIATGEIYMVNRTWTAMSGAIAASASSFDLSLDWGGDQDVLGINGPSILSETATATKDSDASQHFATFVGLKDTQATGDDASVCSAIRSLAPTVAAKASN